MAAAEPTASADTSKPDPGASLANPCFSPEEEASLLADSNAQKKAANTLFTSAAYDDAIQAYSKALATCPNYLDYDIAVLRANIAACHLKLSEWKNASDAATEALDCLDRVDPPAASEKKPAAGKEYGIDGDADSGGGCRVEEVDDDAAARIEALRRSGRGWDDVRKLRAKALLRRAKARVELGAWADLQGADEDYRRLAAMPTLAPLDRKAVDAALRALPPRLDEAKQREMGEMMGKLKQLGNGLLKPFGLSTENFQFVKDEKTGGYSMQMN